MANLQALIRSQLELALRSPAELLESVNQLFFDATAPEHYATLFFGQYDGQTRMLTYISCGRHAPILVRQPGSIEYLEATSTVLVETLFETLVELLKEPSWNCQLCAIHGLGHLHHPDVPGVIQRFIDSHR